MNSDTEKLYKIIKITGGKRIEKFQTPDIKCALNFHKWYVSKYHEGLLMEILYKKISYNWKNKNTDIKFE